MRALPVLHQLAEMRRAELRVVGRVEQLVEVELDAEPLRRPLAVSGISCMRPRAPALDCAAGSNALSWRVMAYTIAFSTRSPTGSNAGTPSVGKACRSSGKPRCTAVLPIGQQRARIARIGHELAQGVEVSGVGQARREIGAEREGDVAEPGLVQPFDAPAPPEAVSNAERPPASTVRSWTSGSPSLARAS